MLFYDFVDNGIHPKLFFAIILGMIQCQFENGNKSSLRHAVVDAVIIKDGKLLMVKRNKKLNEGGKWALVGGFVDRDENLEQAIQREIKEESGYQVENLQILAICDSPNRPGDDRQNIGFVYFCEAKEKIGDSDWEVDAVEWFTMDKLPSREEVAFDHDRFIELYADYQSNKLPLPIFLSN